MIQELVELIALFFAMEVVFNGGLYLFFKYGEGMSDNSYTIERMKEQYFSNATVMMFLLGINSFITGLKSKDIEDIMYYTLIAICYAITARVAKDMSGFAEKTDEIVQKKSK